MKDRDVLLTLFWLGVIAVAVGVTLALGGGVAACLIVAGACTASASLAAGVA